MDGAVLDAAILISAAGGVLLGLVELAKQAGFANDSRSRVFVAMLGGLLLVLLYAFSEDLFTRTNAFKLAAAWVAVSGMGAGLHSMATASSRPAGTNSGPA